jgi:opacity protein-like surface antigen
VLAPRRVALLAAVVLAAGASSAVAANAPTIDKSPLLWATINICDTAKHPDTIGIRASMPGSGHTTEKMYMRFQVQYFRPSTQKWAPTDATFDSGWRMVGAATYRRRESGWNFSITPPPAGQTYRLRGVVSYEWRKGKSTDAVRSAVKRTRSGHPGTFGADPKGFSAAECVVKP